MNAGIIIFVVLLVLAFLGLPIYLSIGIATLVAMLQAGFPLEAIAQKTFLGMNSASLLCIPLFILAGNIMAQGITQKLFPLAECAAAWPPLRCFLPRSSAPFPVLQWQRLPLWAV